jgi:hypothetical protein
LLRLTGSYYRDKKVVSDNIAFFVRPSRHTVLESLYYGNFTKLLDLTFRSLT